MRWSTGSLDQARCYIESQRWFAGKGPDWAIVDVSCALDLGALTLELVTVEHADGTRERYHLPLSRHLLARPELAHAFVGETDGLWVYDAVHDSEAVAHLIDACGAGPEFKALTDTSLPTRVTQHSNSTITVGDQAVLKVFRRAHPGVNPDIEIHRALTAAGQDATAALLGWIEVDHHGEVFQLGMLQRFVPHAQEGWELALSSRDFPAHALGTTIADLHQQLAELFGTGESAVGTLTDPMKQRWHHAVGEVGALAQWEDQVLHAYSAPSPASTHPTQRVHGDLHLGQVLLSPDGWTVLDFEGAPALPLDQRRLPDSRWRDVAGMVHSFDYAARVGGHHVGWAHQCRDEFLEGYLARALTNEERALLQAYVVDRAVYEVVYEARHRPDWLEIALTGLRDCLTH
jgi:maltokinase